MMYPDPEVQKRAVERMEHMRKGDDLVNEEWVITRADGEKRILSMSTGVLDTDTEEVHVLATMHDITDRKQAEEALRQSQEQAELAISGSKGAVWDLEMDPLRPDFIPDAIYLSPILKGFIGFADDAFPNSVRAWHSRILPEDLQLVQQTAQDHLAGRIDLHECQYRIRHKDGSIRWIHTRGRILRDAEGRPVRWIGIDWDITPLKQAEEDQEKLRERLVHGQRLEAIGRLAGGVAHDFNNMLNVILGYTELAMGKVKPSDPLYKDLEEIHRAGMVSADIIRQLLAFARKQPIAPRVLDLNEAVGGALDMLRRLIGEHIELVWIPHTGLWPVKMDPAQIDQILVNLCANAKDAIADTGTITIETDNVTLDEGYCATHAEMQAGDFVLLSVSDDGSGMDATTLASVFEPFLTTKDVAEHSGLGLATVYGIVRQNNGFINVYSEPGKGSRFKTYIPRHAGEIEPIPPKADTSIPSGHGETILIAENETAILEMTRVMLEQLGYTTIAASSPREALRLADACTGGIHLLLTDVVMPEMNGKELSDRLHARHPNVKTLFMSGYSDNVIPPRDALQEGVHFIQKPFSFKDLAAKVREALGDQTAQ